MSDSRKTKTELLCELEKLRGRLADFEKSEIELRRTKDALKKSEDRYRTLVDNSLTGIYLIQGNHLRFANKRTVEMFGYTLEELLQMPAINLTHPDDRKLVREIVARRLAGEDPKEHYQCRALTKNGETLWLETFGTPVDYQGKPALLVNVIDITDRKRADEQIRRSEDKYRTLLDSIEIGFYETDLAGNFLSFSGSISSFLGYSETELLGMNFRQYVDEANAGTIFGAFNTVYRTGRADKGFVCDTISKDGSKRPVEFSVSLMCDAAGKPIGFRGVARDITDRRQAEELLRASEEKYRTLFEESKDVIYITAPDGQVLDINPAGVRLFGASSKEELLKLNVATDIYANPADREKLMRAIAEQGFVNEYELVLKVKDGRLLTFLVTANAMRDEEGNITAYRGIMRDVTERKQLEQQLSQAQRMESIGTLAGGIAHDFNNLLGGILGYASFMKTKISKGHSFFNYVDTIERSAMRAAELTAQLLAFARGGKYEPNPVDMNDIVDETLKIIDRTFDKSIEIEARQNSSSPAVEADAGQIQQVLMNLCVNARDAMPAGGKLILETDVANLTEEYVKTHAGANMGTHVVLSVTDTGIGMDRDTMQRIFEPFFTTKGKGEGTGLGLSMVYGVVKNHGGHVRVYSEPGEGTTFKVYLPVSDKTEVKGLSDIETPSTGNELILVVDDEESIRDVAKDILETYGYRVVLAQNGVEALEVYKERQDEIGLVILDMVMPKMGGRETFQELKKLNPEVRTVLSTGYSQNAKAKEILDNGAMGFVQKPYLVNALLSKVRSALDASMRAHKS